jgi:aldehyde dehydrogenase (NAD+)
MSASPSADPIFGNHIAGESVRGAATFRAFNPTTGEEWGTFVESGPAEIDQAVRAAADAMNGPWSKLSPTKRGRLLMAWGDAIAANAESIGRIETQQNGKLLAEMRTQAVAVKEWLYYFGGLADKIEGRVVPLDRQSVFNYTLQEPLGVIGVIVPWNSPTFITIMSLAPALAAGNTVVVKPSEVTSASAFELARLAEGAGIPKGVINVVTGARAAGEALVDHPLVAKIAFTGSERAGAAIAARAGSRLAAVTLELGGKSPNIVFGDADPEAAVVGVLSGIFAAAGQTCIAGSRAFVHESLHARIVERLVTRARQIRLGDPLQADTQMGPISSKPQLAKDEQMVAKAVEEGASILAGGKRASVKGLEKGLFYEPTILGNLHDRMNIVQEEVFGPVLSILPFSDEDEVIARANGTRFGLAAGIWTRDVRRAHRVARAMQAGTVWINTYRALAPQTPFGGYRNSGIGRVNGQAAVAQFQQTKSVWCELSEEIQDPFVIKL